MPCNWLLQRRTRDEQKANALWSRLNGDFVACSKFDQGTVSGHIADIVFFACDLFFQQHAKGFGCVGKGACTFKDIGKRFAIRVHLEGFFDACRDKNIQILRISGDAIDGTCLPPEGSNDYLYHRAVIIGDNWNILGFDILIPRRSHFQ